MKKKSEQVKAASKGKEYPARISAEVLEQSIYVLDKTKSGTARATVSAPPKPKPPVRDVVAKTFHP